MNQACKYRLSNEISNPVKKSMMKVHLNTILYANSNNKRGTNGRSGSSTGGKNVKRKNNNKKNGKNKGTASSRGGDGGR
jgi:hypothetical protein